MKTRRQSTPEYPGMIPPVRLLKLMATVTVVTALGTMTAHGSEGTIQSPSAGRTVQGIVVNREAQPAGRLQEALAAYDRAFQERDISALEGLLAEDVVLFEQGTHNIGRDDVLTNHLGPELRGFQELSASYSNISVRENASMAMVTRLFSIKGKRQGRFFSIRGSETQGWILRQGRWELMHLHLSFPSR